MADSESQQNIDQGYEQIWIVIKQPRTQIVQKSNEEERKDQDCIQVQASTLYYHQSQTQNACIEHAIGDVVK